jgi:hypothetical protein
MKKSIFYLLTALLVFTSMPVATQATMISSKTELPGDSIPSEASLNRRLEEIKAVDFSTLARSEKAAYKKEVRAIKQTLHDSYGGVFISVGALIIIVLLLILLL